jgi:hypothetical protein
MRPLDIETREAGNLRNLFMKKLTRDRVVPIISASAPNHRAPGLRGFTTFPLVVGSWSACLERPRLSHCGHDTRALQAYLGRRNIQHTVRYTELSPTQFKDFWR